MSLAGFDGLRGFSGTSGRLDQGLTATASSSFQLSSSADLAAFIGSGTTTLPLSCVAASTLSGPGNLLTELLDQAGASLSMSYTYTPTTETTDLASTTSCFAAGTRIATERGDMTVEALHPGDRFRCVLGENAEAIWIATGGWTARAIRSAKRSGRSACAPALSPTGSPSATCCCRPIMRRSWTTC
jgi:hypothetical protein